MLLPIFPSKKPVGQKLIAGARKGTRYRQCRLPNQLTTRDKMSERTKGGVAFWLLGGTGVLLATWQFALIVTH